MSIKNPRCTHEKPGPHIEIEHILKSSHMPKITVSFVPALEKAGFFHFGKEKDQDFITKTVQRAKTLVSPNQYNSRLNMFRVQDLHFAKNKAERVSIVDETARMKKFVPGPQYDLSDKFYRTIGTIKL
jgi:hypothetical protein